MARLIVEEGGARRAFKVGEGKLSIGSGQGAKLRLSADGVAEVHAELEIQGGVATLHPRPGVLPPRVAGVPASGPVRVPPGAPVQIGAATLRLESDADEEAVGGARPARAPVRAGAGAARGSPRAPLVSPSRARAGARDEAEVGAERAERLRRRGPPTWAIVVPLVAVIGVLGFFVLESLTGGEVEVTEGEAEIYFREAQRALNYGRVSEAASELDRIPEAGLTPELRAAVAALRAEIEQARRDGELMLQNSRGTEYLDEQLKRFEKTYLSGALDPPKVRVFLKRTKYFRETWPQHEEMDWIERQERRLAGIVDLSAPPTLADIEFEVKTLTRSTDLRNYKECFAVLENFLEVCGADDRERVRQLIEHHQEEREEWFYERMQRARFEYENDRKGQAVGWLVAIIQYAGDREMEERAASDLVKFENAVPILRGYKEGKPAIYEELKRNRVIAAFIAEKGIDAEE